MDLRHPLYRMARLDWRSGHPKFLLGQCWFLCSEYSKHAHEGHQHVSDLIMHRIYLLENAKSSFSATATQITGIQTISTLIVLNSHLPIQKAFSTSSCVSYKQLRPMVSTPSSLAMPIHRSLSLLSHITSTRSLSDIVLQSLPRCMVTRILLTL
jgi:hypothetical protein